MLLLLLYDLDVVAAAAGLYDRPSLSGHTATHDLLGGDALAVFAFTARGFVGTVRHVHFQYGQVPVVLAVIPAAGLVRHQHLRALMRSGHGGGLFAAALSRRLEPDVFGDVPTPVGPIRTTRTFERLTIQMTDDMHVETRSSSRPKRAVRAFEYLLKFNNNNTYYVYCLYMQCTKYFMSIDKKMITLFIVRFHYRVLGFNMTTAEDITTNCTIRLMRNVRKSSFVYYFCKTYAIISLNNDVFNEKMIVKNTMRILMNDIRKLK